MFSYVFKVSCPLFFRDKSAVRLLFQGKTTFFTLLTEICDWLLVNIHLKVRPSLVVSIFLHFMFLTNKSRGEYHCRRVSQAVTKNTLQLFTTEAVRTQD